MDKRNYKKSNNIIKMTFTKIDITHKDIKELIKSSLQSYGAVIC